MEPLAEENKKLREALNLLEKNIRRAQRERDLAESNSLDLEHQKRGSIRTINGCIRAAEEEIRATGDCIRGAKKYVRAIGQENRTAQK